MNRTICPMICMLTLPLLLAAVSGCNLIAAPFLMWAPEPTKDVPAEFPYLPGRKVCIAVWADSGTLCEHPFVQLELAEHIATAMKPNVEGVSFTPCRQVVDEQTRDAEWDRKDPAVLGARFGADRLLMVELTQYTTREPESPHLYRGRIAANLKVYNTEYLNSAPVFKTSVETAYPPDSIGQWGTSDKSIRKATMEAFATDVAGKFYDRRVKVK